ncbi:diacylglycerol/lipid kinase family protein [Ornithinimicrobium flavum]|uniref:diacylglycerol/lipid kinase family protein n=1 Tax=Ornithinimicrobium flavum TaxID=1288636 RepID=UPI00106FAF84|nr:diacylglycerol kinase family protein [Ornithinimicrobium flavum]
MSTDRPVLVLASPGAGTAHDDVVDRVCRALAARSPSGTQVLAPATDEEYAAAVASAEGRDVVVLGGDGSVHRLLQQLADLDLLSRCGAVGVVPMGTGNDLARGAGLPLSPDAAAQVALSGRPAARGLLREPGGAVVVNAVHCGVAAEATAHAAEVKGVLGRAAYLVGALRAGLTSTGWQLRVVVDGEVVADGSERVLMVSVAVGSSVGGGTPIAPGADPGDDEVEVVVALSATPWARIGFARDLRRGRHTRRSDVVTTRGREVRVEARTPQDAFRVNADGDVEDDRSLDRTWRHEPRAWTLRVPDGRHPHRPDASS